jgi:hypothetical protein
MMLRRKEGAIVSVHAVAWVVVGLLGHVVVGGQGGARRHDLDAEAGALAADWDRMLLWKASQHLHGAVTATGWRRAQPTTPHWHHRRAQQCNAGSKLWHIEPANSASAGVHRAQKGGFLFGSYHHDYQTAWPILPKNNRLALHSCDAVYTEIDFNDKRLLFNYDRCMVLPGNAYNRGQKWPEKRDTGVSLLSMLDTATATAVRRYMDQVARRFPQVGRRLTHGWEALKPMAWMMKYSELAAFRTTAELVKAGASSRTVLDKFIFEQAARSGMRTGGMEDGSHMCLLFDTIETRDEAIAYIGNFLATLKNGLLIELSEDSAQEMLIENVTQTGLTDWYTCSPLCDFAAAIHAGIKQSYLQLGRNVRERHLMQRVQQRQVQALGMYRNNIFSERVAQKMAQRPHLRHCFVLGLAHLLDHGATCQGNDVVQLLNSKGWRVRHINKTDNICHLMPRMDLTHLSLRQLHQHATRVGLFNIPAVLQRAKSEQEMKQLLRTQLQTVAASHPSVLMNFSVRSWLPHESGHIFDNVCRLPPYRPAAPGAICSARNFTCSW